MGRWHRPRAGDMDGDGKGSGVVFQFSVPLWMSLGICTGPQGAAPRLKER